MAGFTKPTTTQTPDALFDYWLSRLTGSELRVLLYAIRRTFGFKRDDDAISREQFLRGITARDGHILDEGTGIRSGATLTAAITKLVEKGLLIRQKRYDPERGHLVSIFSTAISDDPGERATYGLKPVNTTQVPDELFDYWLPRLTDAELCVLLYIIRRTMGFRKQADVISVGQFRSGIRSHDGRGLDEGCGIRTEQALYHALGGLKDKALIRAEQRCDDGQRSLPTRYHLVFEGELPKVIVPDRRTIPTDDVAPNRRSGRDSRAGGHPAEREDVDQRRGLERPIEEGGINWRRGLGQLAEGARSISGGQGGQLARAPGSIDVGRGGQLPEGEGLRQLTPQQTVLQQTVLQETAKQWTDLSKVSKGPSTGDIAQGPTGDTGKPKGPRLYSALIASCIEDWSAEFHDADHFIQNRTRSMRLWAESGLDEDRFMDLMYEARRRTKRALVTKDATDGKSAFSGAKNRMPYFFATLQDLIDNEQGDVHGDL